jgi:formylglycine-generating enzyme required for sulfatase activity
MKHVQGISYTCPPLLVGLFSGIIFKTGNGALTECADVIGTLWLNSLRMTVVPLIVALLIGGIAQTTAAARAGNGKAQHPVTMVNYEDAQSFCRWLSAKEGKTYRLPTDAEWSKAVGLTEDASPAPAQRHYDGSTVFPWGHYYPPKRRDGNFNTVEVDDGYDDTAPVMSFRPNKIGIYDLGGNVSEWCNDWYDQSREYRFLRGSSWGDGGREQLHSSSRFGDYPPDYRDEHIGFRCVFVVAGG